MNSNHSGSTNRVAFLSPRTPFFATVLAASLTIGSTLLAGGCGSSNRTVTLPGTAISAASYTGRSYTSQVALPDSQTGSLTMQVTANGTASGTVTITGPSAARGQHAATRQTTIITIATANLTGTFDLATGAVHLTGSYTFNGAVIPITVDGTLPVPPSYSGGSVTITVNGHAYTTTFGSVAVTPTPTPVPTGTPTPGTTPTPTPTPATTPSPGTLNQLMITADSGSSNNTSSTLVGMSVSAEANIHNVGGNRSSLTVVVTNDPNQTGTNVTSLQLDIDVYHILSTETIAVGGTTFNAATGTSDVITLSYLELQGGGQRSWFNTNDTAGGNSGQIVIEQLDAGKVRVDFVNALVDPLPGSQATGKLRINGTVETTETPDYH